jgi:MFS family permease
VTRRQVERRYALLSALRWLPIGLGLPFFTLLPLARGLSLAEVGVAFAFHGALIFLLEVPSGALADTIGRRRAVLAGGVLTAAGMAAFAVAMSFGGVAAAMALVGVGRSLISGALEAWFVDTVRVADPDASLREGLAGGLILNGVSLAAGSLIAGAVPLLFDDLPARGDDLLLRYSPAFLVAAASALVFLLAVAVLVHEAPRQAVAAATVDAPDEVPAPVASFRRRFVADLRDVLRTAVTEGRASPVVRLVLGVSFTTGFALSAWELLWQPRLAGLVDGAADDTVLFGGLSAAGMLVGTVGVIAGLRLAGRFGAGRTYVGGVLATGVALALLAATTAAGPFVGLYLVVAFAMSIGEPLHYEFLHEAVGDRARATLASVESLALQFGAVVANVGLAALAGATSIPTAWLVAAGARVGGAAVAARVARAAAPG